ncbi:MAG: beta-N-acetylhexosaminidase [Ruminococcaceae bacterium]|nr:beta-N-acetylhexosaminidase [Oscillospiraceae bacterium]
MNIKFANLDTRYKSGMEEFLKFHNIDSSKDGFNITIEITDEEIIKISKEFNEIKFTLNSYHQIFRAICLLKEHIEKDSFEISEKCYFKTLCAMFDGSQANSLMNVETCKKMMLNIASMGYNAMMLYCEDCYEIKEEPYFGNMRPKYFEEDFKLLDDYAYSLGIELIPCIQTLGHLPEFLRQDTHKSMRDTPSVLLVGDDRSYSLIEKMVSTVKRCFRSNRVHIGLDEAWMLGRGNYFKKHGYVSADLIMKEHLEKVYAIVHKYDLRPMMWGDMFFRAKSMTEEYYDTSIVFTDEDRKGIPDDLSLIYWDYYSTEVKHYEDMINKTKELTDNVIYANAIGIGRTFGYYHKSAFDVVIPSLIACKNQGVKEVLATAWGDNNRESSFFNALIGLQLYAEHMYHENPDEDFLKKQFKLCTDCDYTSFENIKYLDCAKDYNGNNDDNISLSRVFMWQDILLPLCDADLGDFDFYEHYRKLEIEYKEYAIKNPKHSTIFEFYSELAKVLKVKANISRDIAKAYYKNDIEKLKNLKDTVLPKLYDDVLSLRKAHKKYHRQEYKPIGWEILDIRYGGVLMRIDTAIERIADFTDGKINKIDELDEKRLSFTGKGKLRRGIEYRDICSASSL